MQPLHSLSEHQMQEFQHPFLSRQFLDGNCARCIDGCGQYLWVCPVGVAMVPDGNPKKLEPMSDTLEGYNRLVGSSLLCRHMSTSMGFLLRS